MSETPTPPSGTATADVILVALGGLRDEVRQTREESAQRGKETAARLEKLEETASFHAQSLKRLTDEVTAHGKQISGIVDAQTSTARAASLAAELSAQAHAKVNAVHDETRKMVESAMEIQRGAITSAVGEAVKPLADDIAAIKASDAEQTRALALQDERLALTVKLLSDLSRYKNHWAFKVGLVIGGLIAGWYATTHALPR